MSYLISAQMLSMSIYSEHLLLKSYFSHWEVSMLTLHAAFPPTISCRSPFNFECVSLNWWGDNVYVVISSHIYLLVFNPHPREREREALIGCLPQAPLSGDGTCNPGDVPWARVEPATCWYTEAVQPEPLQPGPASSYVTAGLGSALP